MPFAYVQRNCRVCGMSIDENCRQLARTGKNRQEQARNGRNGNIRKTWQTLAWTGTKLLRTCNGKNWQKLAKTGKN